MTGPNNDPNTRVAMARIDKNIRDLAGGPAIELIVERMGEDLRDKRIPFEVEAVGVENHCIYADVRVGVVVRVSIADSGSPDQDNEDIEETLAALNPPDSDTIDFETKPR